MAIFKKRGKYWIGFRGLDGKRHREPIGSTHTLAREVLAKRLAEVAEGKHFPGRVANGKPFAALLDKYWSLHGQTLRSRSWAGMLERIRSRFAGKRIADVTTTGVQGFYNEVAAAASHSTANRHLTLLRSIFNKAKVWADFVGDNPCSGVSKGRENAHRLRYLDAPEIDRLLLAAHPRLLPLLQCALHTGMRKGELLALDWANVGLESSAPTIYVLVSKSGKPREIPIDSPLRGVLRTLGPRPSGPVFELPEIMLRRYFAKALKDARIDGFRFHDLRHTFASWFIMRTNDLPALQRILGHSTPMMTQRYAHLSKGHLASAMAVFESAIPSRPQAVTPEALRRTESVGAA